MSTEWQARFAGRLAEAASAVPLVARVSLRRPLFLFHVPKTAGSSMRTLLDSAVGRPRRSLLPCVNCACKCDPLAAQRRNRTSCDVAFLGHLFPFATPQGKSAVPLLLRLDRGAYGRPRCRRHWEQDGLAEEEAVWRVLNQSLCVALVRDPIQRLASSYYEFVHRKSSNRSLPSFLEAFGPERLVAAAGGGRLYASLLGGGSVERAERILSTCATGVQERYPEFVATLSRLLPVDTASVAAAPREHSHRREGMGAAHDYAALAERLLPLMPSEARLWAHASAVAAEQHRMALAYAPLSSRGAEKRGRAVRRAPSGGRARRGRQVAPHL